MTAERAPGLVARMRGWTLRRRVGAMFTALAALLAVLVAVIVVSLADFVSKGSDVVYRLGPAEARSQSLLADLVNQETGVRGYALSRRPEFLRPFHDYRDQEQADRRALHGYLAGRRALVGDLDDLERAADDWRNRTALPLIALTQAGVPQAPGRLDAPADKARFDLIRQRSTALTQAVDRVAAAARGDRRRAAIFLVAALSIATVVLTVAGLGTWRGLHRWVLRPLDRLAAQTRAVANGHPDARIEPIGPPEIVALGADVETMRRSAADSLARVETARAELARSNDDLEQFAYVASHDLSEPLRKVANFCQLLERQYGAQLDDKARQYVAFAVDGAKRMQILINDLLSLSRVGRTTETFGPVDTEAVLSSAIANLEGRIAESGAGVGHSDLPTVQGDQSLLVVLFENLIANAVKYRGTDPPLVVVTASKDPTEPMWTFGVSDNGIGIDPQYSERIFAIFQRLHLRDEYDGTGIGLALCRKIVEFHGGRIWLDTHAPTPGATFRFTLPEGPLGDH